MVDFLGGCLTLGPAASHHTKPLQPPLTSTHIVPDSPIQEFQFLSFFNPTDPYFSSILNFCIGAVRILCGDCCSIRDGDTDYTNLLRHVHNKIKAWVHKVLCKSQQSHRLLSVWQYYNNHI